jgi:pyruvate/2-oxoglutarate dehydrogenase complex dihydrolipoamide dehydrogenase (E3) component
VIIGDTAAAKEAATFGVTAGAKIAWAIPEVIEDIKIHPQADWYLLALIEAARVRQGNGTKAYWYSASAAIETLSLQAAPALLAMAGVDTIVGTPEFFRLPHLGVRVGKRTLRARSYLVATGSVPPDVESMPGLEETGYVTIQTLANVAQRQEIPQRWAIIGTEVGGVELAQTLARIGHQVTAIIEGERILPQEDPQVSYQIQQLLEAEGVEIYLNRSISAVRAATGHKLIFMGDETIAVDEIFVALPDRPAIETFNLAGVEVDYDDMGISVNERLQTTTNPRIYACGSVCGSVLGGYHSDRLSRAEARVATHNCLWWRKREIDYDCIPHTLNTEPPLARVGLSATAAADHQGAIMLEHRYHQNQRLAIDSIKTGWCQMIISKRGEILGATIWGERATELIEIIAFAMSNRLPIDRLSGMVGMSPTYAEIIYQTAAQWPPQGRKISGWRRFWWKCLRLFQGY